MKRTLAAKDNGKVPELGHIVRLKDLTLVGSAISIQCQRDILLILVLARECDTGTNRNLSTDDAISTVKARGEHVHGPALSVGNALSPAKQFANDGLDASPTHEGEAVATVGGDEMVFALDCVLNADRDGFLSGRQVAEAANLLLLIQPVGSHLHASATSCQLQDIAN